MKPKKNLVVLLEKSIALFVCCCFCCGISIDVSAQSITEKGLPFITNFTPKMYESAPQNFSVIEDKRGLMYFGNLGSILEYDGVRWHKIALEGNNVYSTIRALVNDEKGRVLYGTSGDVGYLEQDSLGATVCHSLLEFIPISKRDFHDVWTICPIKNGFYLQSRERIFKFIEKDSAKKEWQVQSWDPETRFMYAFYLNGTYYVHELGKGLLKMQNDSLTVIPGSEFLGKERTQVMLPYASNGSDKQYIVGMFYSGLYLYNGKTFKPFKTDGDSIMRTATLYKGFLLKDGSYALSTTGKGLMIINKDGKVLQHINRNVGLQDESVYALYEDSKQNIWLSLDNGVSRVQTSSPITQFSNQSGINTSALFVQRFEGLLYVGTTNGLLVFNNNTRHFEPVSAIHENQVFSMFSDTLKKQLLVATDGLYSIQNKKVNILHGSSGDLQIDNLIILAKHPDILLCSASFGINVFKRNHNTTDPSKEWILEGLLPGISDQTWTFAEEKSGMLWAGTQIGAVYKITLAFDSTGGVDLKKTGVEKFGSKEGLKFGSGPVLQVKGKAYFSADSALYTFNESTKKFVIDTTFGIFKNGGGKDEYYLAQDYKGRVWVRFGRDIRLATPIGNGRYHIDYRTPLLPVTDRTVSQIYPEADGTVWVCTTDGLIRYEEGLQKDYDQPYKTLLRYIKAGSTILSTIQQDEKQKTEISFQNNSMRFEYAAVFFTEEEKTRYQTWLEGFDKDWSTWGNNYYKEYTNLPEGKYTFHVRAKNVFENLSDDVTYTFVIQPPWFRTWWAYTGFILLIIGLIWAFIFYRSRRLLNENKKLEEKVTQRTDELKQSIDKLKSTQTQLVQSEKMASLGELTAGIAHEIQNPLNFVNNFSEVNIELISEMKENIDSGKYDDVKLLANDIEENEQKINHHGKRADAIVKSMLQHSRASTGQKESTDINALADEYLRLSYHGLRAKDKSFNAKFETVFDATISNLNIVQQDVGRVILNLINNAFYAVSEKQKQNIAGYKPTVTITTKNVTDAVEIIISDNGNGIPQHVVNKIFQPFFTTKPTGEGTGLGLSLSYDIIKAHSGEIRVETKDGEGTSFIIQLPNK